MTCTLELCAQPQHRCVLAASSAALHVNERPPKTTVGMGALAGALVRAGRPPARRCATACDATVAVVTSRTAHRRECGLLQLLDALLHRQHDLRILSGDFVVLGRVLQAHATCQRSSRHHKKLPGSLCPYTADLVQAALVAVGVAIHRAGVVRRAAGRDARLRVALQQQAICQKYAAGSTSKQGCADCLQI